MELPIVPIMSIIHDTPYVIECFRARLAVEVLLAEAKAEDASRGARKAAREVR